MHFCDFQCGRLRYGWMVLIGVLIQSASQRQVRTTQHLVKVHVMSHHGLDWTIIMIRERDLKKDPIEPLAISH